MKVYKVRLEIQPHDPSDDDAEPWSEDKVVQAADENAAGYAALNERLSFYAERDGINMSGTIVRVEERIA